ncbi:MAG: hypothetical protein ACXWC7_12415 [Chitinophagaceae bacterium]
MGKNFVWIAPCAFFLVVACSNNESGIKKKVDPEAIYFDYRVWGDEEENDITVRLQYFMGYGEGSTILWESPAKVEFDGEFLQVDSSRRNGYYYEARIPLENFAGKHSIVFTDLSGKKYIEEFGFSLISLRKELPAVLTRDEFVLELAGLDSGGIVKVLISDTAFYSRGIDRIDTVRNDSIIITPRDLESLKNGPVYLEIYKDEEWPLKQPGTGGGKLFLSYGLRRAFELKDAPIP